MSFSDRFVAAGTEEFSLDECPSPFEKNSNPGQLSFPQAFAHWLHEKDPKEDYHSKYFYYDDFCRMNVRDDAILIMWRPLYSVISYGIAERYGWELELETRRLRLAAERANILHAFTDRGYTIMFKSCPNIDYVTYPKRRHGKKKLWEVFKL